VERIVSLAVPILFGIIVVVGLLGNLLVVIVVMANQQMRSTTNLLIINLALADLLFIVFCVPFTAVDYMLPYWPFGDVWCKMVQYLIVVTAYASVYTLVLMSLDRFLAVVHPIASIYVRTERNASSAIMVTWVLIVLLALPVLARHGEVTYTFSSAEHTACIFLDRDPNTRPDGYNKPAYQVGGSFLPPFRRAVGSSVAYASRPARNTTCFGGAAPAARPEQEALRIRAPTDPFSTTKTIKNLCRVA